MRLKVDYRETNFHTIPGCEIENLLVGDFEISDGDTPVFILERKTLSDMVSSLHDGRYHEQKCRLHGVGCKAGYIIENYTGWSGLPSDAVRTMLLNLQVVDNFAVFTSANARETARIVRHVHERMCEHPEKYVAREVTQYVANVRTKKSDNLTPASTAVLQLCNIQKVSARVAECILAAFSARCMGDLVRAAGPRAGFVDRVAALKPGNKRLGPKLAEEVYDALFGPDTPPLAAPMPRGTASAPAAPAVAAVEAVDEQGGAFVA